MEKKIDTTIFELPDELINHIFSFLPMEKAYRMSFLSKSLKNIWDTHTLLSMDLSKIFEYGKDPPKAEKLNFIDKYFRAREKNKVNIKKFRLEVYSFDSQFGIYMDTWVQRLIRCNVKEMYFRSSLYNIHYWPNGYSFPQAIFSAESLTKLILEGCRLECKYFANIKLFSLKELFLKFVNISNESLEQLIKSCVALEHLLLDTCQGFTSLKVAGLRCLNKLTVADNVNLERVEVEEPTLFRIFMRYDRSCSDCNYVKFENCTGLKKLILINADITDEGLSEQLSVLNNLEDLELFFCRKINSLNISSSRLKRLLILHRDELSEVNINTPNLQLFSLWSMYNSNKKLLSVSLNAPPTVEVELDITAQVIGRDWYIDLLNFISVFDSSLLTLDTNLPDSKIPQEWMDYFSHTKSVARFQKFWIDPETRLLDVLSSIYPDLEQSSRRRDYIAKILTEEEVELKPSSPEVYEAKFLTDKEDEFGARGRALVRIFVVFFVIYFIIQINCIFL